MNEVKRAINEAIDAGIEYQIIINSLKRELPSEAVYDLYRSINSGEQSTNTNLHQFLVKNKIEGTSRAFIRKIRI